MRVRSKSGIIGAVGVVAMIGGFGSRGFAAPSGNMNLRMKGYELVTPNSGSAARVDIDGIGQLIADTSGTFSGAETFTAVDPSLPPSSASEEVCAGTIAGTITAPSGAFASGTGEFTLTSSYTPSSASTSTYCIPVTVTMLCNRTLANKKNTNDLDGGQYRCLATSVTTSSGANTTINAAVLSGHVDSVSGANAPTD